MDPDAPAHPALPENLLAPDELRLTRARAVLADHAEHSDARRRRACRTVLDVLPDDEEHHDERSDAAEMLELLNRGMPA